MRWVLAAAVVFSLQACHDKEAQDQCFKVCDARGDVCRPKPEDAGTKYSHDEWMKYANTCQDLILNCIKDCKKL